jgi:hypothetical protein
MITAKSTLIATIHVKYIFSCVTYVYSSTSRMLSNCELKIIYLGRFSQRTNVSFPLTIDLIAWICFSLNLNEYFVSTELKAASTSMFVNNILL